MLVFYFYRFAAITNRCLLWTCFLFNVFWDISTLSYNENMVITSESITVLESDWLPATLYKCNLCNFLFLVLGRVILLLLISKSSNSTSPGWDIINYVCAPYCTQTVWQIPKTLVKIPINYFKHFQPYQTISGSLLPISELRFAIFLIIVCYLNHFA